jgi:hypothetical protein
VTEADAKRALCADFLRGRAASNPQERESVNQRLLADAALFDQAGDHATAKGIRALVDAIRTVDRLRRERTQMSVFLDNDASQIEIDAVEQSLSNAPGVVTVRFESKEEAYERFKEVFADQPTLIEYVSPDALPPSFRVQLTSSETFDQVAAMAEVLPGVTQATVDLTESGAELKAWEGLPALRECLLTALSPPSSSP